MSTLKKFSIVKISAFVNVPEFNDLTLNLVLFKPCLPCQIVNA